MTGEEMAKTEFHRTHTLERVTSFDKNTLRATITEEKVILPDTDTLSMVGIVCFSYSKIIFEQFKNINKT